MAKFEVFCLFLFFFSFSQYICSSTPNNGIKSIIINVSPDGVSNKSCLLPSASTKCSLLFALKYVLQNATSAEVIMDSGNYNLNESFKFKSLTNFSLVGNSSDPDNVKIQCTKGAFISIENSTNIVFDTFTLDGCGNQFNFSDVLCHKPPDDVKPYFFTFFTAAVVVMNSDYFRMRSTVISNSYGMALKLCSVTSKPAISVEVIKSSFVANNIPQGLPDHELLYNSGYQGGGVNFDLFAPTNDRPTVTYHFLESNFTNNIGGSGITMLLWEKTNNTVITVDNCHFVSNIASFGGGLFLEFHDQVQNNQLIVKNSKFYNNIAKYGGGAIRTGIAIDTQVDQGICGNIIYQQNCIFANNSALFGGAASHFQNFYYPVNQTDRRNSTTFSNCEFINNKATMGSAIGLAGSTPLSYILQSDYNKAFQPYHVVIEDCNITDNQMKVEQGIIGVGALYSFAVPTVFIGHVKFERNTATACVIDSAYLRVFGDCTFNSNTGLEGGGLALYGDSKLIMMENSSLYFARNNADERGGAMFVRVSGLPVVPFNTTLLNTRTCFLVYKDDYHLQNISNWKTKITFNNNKAPLTAGLAIYANTLQSCRNAGDPRINRNTMEWKFVHYHDDNATLCNISYQVSTDPLKIIYNISDWHIAPTEKFNVTVQLRDEKDSLAYGIVRVLIKEQSQVKLTTSPLFLVQDNAQIPNLRLKGHGGTNFSVQLRMASGQIVQSEVSSQTLKPCNPGFHQNYDSDQCTCMKKTITGHGISDCLSDGKTVYIREGYWAGMVDNKFASFPCPCHHCHLKKIAFGSFRYNKAEMCDKHRNESSVLCGSCVKGYSVSLGSESCVNVCSNNHLWLLVVFFIGTLLAVLLILRIDVDIFTIYLNAWLYSYQVILFLQKKGQSFDPFIRFIIGIANWQISHVETCLFQGMNNLTKLYVNYMFPVYVLLLLVVLAKIARHIRNCYINRNVFRACSTLLVLCYTDITMISYNALHYVPVGDRYVLYVDGDIDFSKNWKTHIPLTIIASLWIVFFVALLPVILLRTHWFIPRIRFLNNFRGIFDTFQSCYKDEYRWFSAFYFLCRIAVLVISMFVEPGPLQRALLEMLCVVIFGVCVLVQPYNDDYRHFNYLDAILLSNLCFFTIFSSAVNSEATETLQKALQKYVLEISAYVPLIYLVILSSIFLWNYWRVNKGQDRRQYENLDNPSSVSETIQPTSSNNTPI